MTPTQPLVAIADLMQTSGVTFGTSGARGLVTAMTDKVCYAYASAFLQYLRSIDELGERGAIALGGDLRASSGRIMQAIGAAITESGFSVINCGTIPTPAIAQFGMLRAIPSIMVTGSHIPDDRNGIKFYKRDGEILKADEEGIRRQSVRLPQTLSCPSLPPVNREAYQAYVDRYVNFLPELCLRGLRLGLYEHSGVGRDVFFEILNKLGADVVRLDRTDAFIPVDTEAIRPQDVTLAQQWTAEHHFDAIISADGDGDRPLISDEQGKWLRGDIAGILCAQYLGAETVVTPVSSNTAVEKSGLFKSVRRTRIGSPFVIEEMMFALREGAQNVVGYEANGGFLTATNIVRHGATLTALPTRDAMIVPLAILLLASQKELSISQLTAQLPPRYTISDRVKEFPTQLSAQKIAALTHAQPKQAIETVFGNYFGEVANWNMLDGLRITFENSEVVHLRPSGNAPEFRCYTEADSEARATEMNTLCMNIIKSWLPHSPT